MVAAPAQYGVFQRGAQAGQGLAGIEQASPGAFQQGHVAVDLGRHAGERLHEVQRGALAGQHHPRGAAQPAKRLVRRQTVAVSHQPLHQHTVAQLNKDLIQPAAAQNMPASRVMTVASACLSAGNNCAVISRPASTSPRSSRSAGDGIGNITFNSFKKLGAATVGTVAAWRHGKLRNGRLDRREHATLLQE